MAGADRERNSAGKTRPGKPRVPTNDSKRIAKDGPGLGTRLAVALLMRVAARSVPGAIAVGGGLVAKALIERRRRRKAGAAVEDPTG